MKRGEMQKKNFSIYRTSSERQSKTDLFCKKNVLKICIPHPKILVLFESLLSKVSTFFKKYLPWALQHEIVLRVVTDRCKFEYPSNQQEIIYRMNLIFSKWVADSWGTFLMSLIQKTYPLLVLSSVNPLPKICKKITLLS